MATYSDTAIDAWCADLQEIGSVILQSLPDIDAVCRDPDDDHVITAALAVKADIIVTGDKDLLDLGKHQCIRILTAKAFLDPKSGSCKAPISRNALILMNSIQLRSS